MPTLGKPEPHSDVLNKQPRTLLIGYGWVGQFVHKYFTEADIYTKDGGMVYHEGRQKGERWDVAFISVPTPMLPNGRCDTSIVEECVNLFKDQVELFIIRSTVDVATTDYLKNKYTARIVMQPEYVGETLGHPMLDPQRDPFIILGGSSEDTKRAAELWSKVLHANCKIRQVSSKTAELCKYMENSFLATKVIFVNEFRQLAEKLGVDFLELREAWLDDPRIGRSHTLAYKDNPGFSGKCLPKDLNAIAAVAKHVGSPLKLIESVLEINAEMRKDIESTVPLLPNK